MLQCAAFAFIPVGIQKKAKKSGCTAFTTGSRVSLGPLLKWLFTESAGDHDWKDHYNRFHALREELAHKREAGETLSKTEIHFAVSKATNAFFSLEDRQANIELPPELKGLSEVECQARLLRASEAKKQAFIVALGELGKDGK